MLKTFFRAILYRIRGEYTTETLVKMGMRVGQNFHRLIGVILDPAHCWLIEIGDNVTLAPRVHILCHDASTVQWLGYAKIGKVKIGNNVFIGAESVVLPNVTIGDNVIIGANSTVTRDVEANSIYAGNPAKKISSIEEFISKNKELMELCPLYGEEYTTRGHIDNEKKIKMQEELEEKYGYVR